jgi:putative tricarboxylic transport membrane protein
MAMSIKNIIAGILLAIIGISFGLLSLKLPDRAAINVPGPDFFPGLISIIVVFLSSMMLLQGLLELVKHGRQQNTLSIPFKAIVVLVVIASYIFLLPYLGFLFGGFIFFPIIMFMSGSKKWLAIAICSIVIPLILFYLFRGGFLILLPHASWM